MDYVIIVGAGPVGLWTALQIKKRRPEWQVRIYERHEHYQRSHVLRLDHWSLLLYGRNSRDARERQFYEAVTGKGLAGIASSIAKSVYIRTLDLEAEMRTYALDKGIEIVRQVVDDPRALMEAHPESRLFIAADGAHSRMRTALLGSESIHTFPLQHVVELKYEVEGPASRLKGLGARIRASTLKFMAFEYVGKMKDERTPVTIRFFLDAATYEAIPEASFKQPLALGSGMLPDALEQDIHAHLAARAGGEPECVRNARVTKLTLSLYAARRFSVSENGRAWFLVGDAAMGVPYFRSLNSGLILGSRLAQIMTARSWPLRDRLARKVWVYELHRWMHIQTEFIIARAKNWVLDAYDRLRWKRAAVARDGDVRAPGQRAFGCEDAN